MDLVTHFPATDCSYDAIYIVTDRPSKFMCFIPCKHTVSAAGLVWLFLANVVAYHGMPASIVSHCGLWFTTHFQFNLISALGCKHSLSLAFHPEMDSLSKRMHRSIEQILYCQVSAQQVNLDLLFLICKFALNSTHSTSTGINPVYLCLVANLL